MSRIHNPFDRACRAVLLSPALFGLVEGLRLSIGPVQSLQWSHPRTYRVHEYARLHWAQGSRGTQLPIEPGKHLSCSRAGSLPHATVMVVTAFWCWLNLSCSTFCWLIWARRSLR